MTSSGSLLLGSSREFVGLDRSVSKSIVQSIAARALRFLPVLSRTSIIRSYAGLRPWSPDHLPLIGPVESVPGFYVAAGHEGAGIGLAPITGHLIARWITGGELPATICATAVARPLRRIDRTGIRRRTPWPSH
jgi:sarcosine oxidase subunit beta